MKALDLLRCSQETATEAYSDPIYTLTASISKYRPNGILPPTNSIP